MRQISYLPEATFFKPQGIPLTELDRVVVSHEELEAIRLVDFLGLEQKEAAERMDISRRSMAADLKTGRRKIADAILHGKAIAIQGGDFVYQKGSETRKIYETEE